MHAFETGQSKSGSIIRKRKDISGNTEQVVVDPNIVRLYLDRGVALFDICPYVFVSEYRTQPVALSKATKRRPGKKTHVHLTAAGVKALEGGAELEPRRHYEFNEGSGYQRWYKLQPRSDLYYKYHQLTDFNTLGICRPRVVIDHAKSITEWSRYGCQPADR